jgi:hybrid cluster-associated redox disulfide protein
MGKDKEITKDLTIMEVLQKKPEAAQVFARFGMHCLGCLVASGETVEQAAMAHGLDADEIIKALNEA